MDLGGVGRGSGNIAIPLPLAKTKFVQSGYLTLPRRPWRGPTRLGALCAISIVEDGARGAAAPHHTSCATAQVLETSGASTTEVASSR